MSDDTFLDKLNNFCDYLLGDLGPGPNLIKMNWIINLQKGGSLPFFLYL